MIVNRVFSGIFKRSAAVKTAALIALAAVVFPVSDSFAGPADRQVFLRVNPLAGETKTSGTGGRRGVLGVSSIGRQNTTKTITRNMKWNCEVRYRGKPLPDRLELKVFYIGSEAKDVKPKILGRETVKLALDEAGKTSVEIESPTVRYTKSRTSGVVSGGHVSKGRSTASGQRISGCVVQLWEDGKLVKSYASQSVWDRAAKSPDFNDAALTGSSLLK